MSMGFKKGYKYFVRSEHYPFGVNIMVKNVARMPGGAVLAFCETGEGKKISFPVSRWDRYKIYEVREVSDAGLF